MKLTTLNLCPEVELEHVQTSERFLPMLMTVSPEMLIPVSSQTTKDEAANEENIT